MLTSCSGHSGTEYAASWSPDKQERAVLSRVSGTMGWSSEFRLVVSGKTAHISKTVPNADGDWLTTFAEIFWSSDSTRVVLIMTNSFSPQIAIEAIDVRSGRSVDVASLIPAIRKRMISKWGAYLDSQRDPFEQARRPGKALSQEFVHRIVVEESSRH